MKRVWLLVLAAVPAGAAALELDAEKPASAPSSGPATQPVFDPDVLFVGPRRTRPTSQEAPATAWERPEPPPTSMPATRPAPRKVVDVKTLTGLFEAIGSNRHIRLAAGAYSLKDIQPSQLNSRHVRLRPWQDVHGYQPEIHDLRNLRIEGLGEKPVRLITPHLDYSVLDFSQVADVELVNLEFGHDPEAVGPCQAGVIYAYHSSFLRFERCVLFGCGTYGLVLNHVAGLDFDHSVIRDCSQGILIARNAKALRFSQARFEGNKGAGFHLAQCRDVRVEDCTFKHNAHRRSAIAGNALFRLTGSRDVVIRRCRGFDNRFGTLVSPPGAARVRETTIRTRRARSQTDEKSGQRTDEGRGR